VLLERFGMDKPIFGLLLKPVDGFENGPFAQLHRLVRWDRL